MASMEEIHNSGILVVDDEPANLVLIQKILELDGYTHIVSTTNSTEVMGLFKQHRPSLILLDLNMPTMDGFDVLQQFHDSVPVDEFPSILVLTAQTDRDSRLRALNSGARDYVHKPFDRIELLSRIKIQLEVKLLHARVKNQNKLLEQKVRERTQELNNTRLEVIHRLGLAAEYRDNETGLHIIRMSKISMELGKVMGLSDTENELLLNASPMHDIGKIGIPDSVLLKPGKLDPDEWEIMKTHAAIGAEILSGGDSELLEMARVIALSHHEKWDGSGYPEGLNGNDIPLVGRIVALADVFDALTSERPYKKAWPVDKAIEFIQEQSGKHFDPEIVEKFEVIMPKVMEIIERYSESGRMEKAG